MPVLQFVKTHLTLLLCALFALVFIAGAVLGVSSDKVVSEMRKEISRTGAADIAKLKSSPKNVDLIAKKKLEGELFEREYAETVEAAKSINQREVLMKGVFPQAEKAATPYEFQELYRKTMEKNLHVRLRADTLPTEAEIREEEQNVEDLLLLEAEQRAEEQKDESGRTPPVAAAPRRATPGRSRVAPEAGRMRPGIGRGLRPGVEGAARFAGPGETGAGGLARSPVTRSGEPKYDPVYRARVSKAKSIRCYYDQTAFHISPLAYESTAPSPEQMWFAQVGLWVQEDVVKAIAELNQQAADRVTAADACVEHVPVKRLVLLRVIGYDLGSGKGLIPFPLAAGVGLPDNVGGPSFTGRKCNEQYDVVRFVVSVVVDQRDVLRLIDAISRVNFYQCLSVSYEAVDQALEMQQGYFYGTDPVVKATLEFEGYMAREVYEELMPPAIRKLLGIDDEGD